MQIATLKKCDTGPETDLFEGLLWRCRWPRNSPSPSSLSVRRTSAAGFPRTFCNLSKICRWRCTRRRLETTGFEEVCHSRRKTWPRHVMRNKLECFCQAWVRLPLDRKWMGQKGTGNIVNGMGLVLRILLITAHEWQMGINDTIPNVHEQYLPFMIIHNSSYIINRITLFYLFCSIESCILQKF